MNNLFAQSRSHCVRYDRYEIKTGKDGKRYITPEKTAKPDIYNPLKESSDMVLEALNVGGADDEPQVGGCGGKGNSGLCEQLRSVGADDGTAHHAVLYGL